MVNQLPDIRQDRVDEIRTAIAEGRYETEEKLSRLRDAIGRGVSQVLARLMHRAHSFGSDNPLAAFYGRPEPIEAYFDTSKNLPVATPLLRKDCSPICDGAAAVILTSRPKDAG